MNRPVQPILDKRGEPHVRRFEEQRWLLDNIIRANGIDWDQPRSLYLSGPCGNEANADFAGIRERVKKMADIGPAFEAVARRREAKAKAAEEADRKVTARDNYFMAAVHWGAAQWPYDQNDETNIAYNNKKRECYAKYAAPRRPPRRTGLGAVPGQGDPGLVPPAAGLPGRPHPGGDRDPRHGQLQGNPGRALWRPLPQPRHGGAGDRRARTIRSADARRLFLGGELDRGRQAAGRLARQPSRDRRRAHRLLRHQLRHLLRHHPHRLRAAHPRVCGDVGVP